MSPRKDKSALDTNGTESALRIAALKKSPGSLRFLGRYYEPLQTGLTRTFFDEQEVFSAPTGTPTT
jgi:hypothetical protein